MKSLLIVLAASLTLAACGKPSSGAAVASSTAAAHATLRGVSAGGNAFAVDTSSDFKVAMLTWDVDGTQIVLQQYKPAFTVRCPCSFYEGTDAAGARADLMIELSNVTFKGAEPAVATPAFASDTVEGNWEGYDFTVAIDGDKATLTWSDDGTQIVAKLTDSPLGGTPRCLCKVYQKVGPDAIRQIIIERSADDTATATYIRRAITLRD